MSRPEQYTPTSVYQKRGIRVMTRPPIYMVEEESLTMKEIAKRLDKPVSVVQDRRHRIIAKGLAVTWDRLRGIKS